MNDAHIILVALGMIGAALAVFARQLFRFGGLVAKLEGLDDKLKALDLVPIINQRVEQHDRILGRAVSDIAELRESRGEFRGRFESIQDK